ncbi:MAG: hypothetical protein ABI169_11095, partial [Chitinophagaceae bacterium]
MFLPCIKFIPPGKSLTISDMQIEFGPNGSIDVQTSPGSGLPGGYLELNNTTLTADRDCGMDNNHWQGVTVEGDAMNDQFTHSFAGAPGRYQGFVRMSNNSVISYATTGVSCITSGTLRRNNKAGGVIIASNSRFEDNNLAVNMSDYLKPISLLRPYSYGNQSQFRNCDFTSSI